MIEFEIKYERRIVAFLDVLGFKQHVFRSNNNLLNKYFSIVQNELANLRGDKKEIKSLIVSDSIVLVTRTTQNDFKSLLILISKIQTILGLNNIWLRGGISIGDIYYDQEKSLMVGPALIQAYLIEEEFAKYPRVILDTKLLLHFNANPKKMLNLFNNIFRGSSIYKGKLYDNIPLLRYNEINEDGLIYISYSTYFICRLLNWDNENKDYEISVSKFFKTFKNEMYSSTKHYDKYQWIREKLQLALSDIEYYYKKRETLPDNKVKRLNDLRGKINEM